MAVSATFFVLSAPSQLSSEYPVGSNETTEDLNVKFTFAQNMNQLIKPNLSQVKLKLGDPQTEVQPDGIAWDSATELVAWKAPQAGWVGHAVSMKVTGFPTNIESSAGFMYPELPYIACGTV